MRYSLYKRVGRNIMRFHSERYLPDAARTLAEELSRDGTYVEIHMGDSVERWQGGHPLAKDEEEHAR